MPVWAGTLEAPLSKERLLEFLGETCVPSYVDRSFLIGPLDTCVSQDSLLKTLEEPPMGVLFHLWASDLSQVIQPIVSRCVPIWCRGDLQEEDARLWGALESGDLATLVELVQGSEPTSTMSSVMASLRTRMDPGWVPLYEAMRELHGFRHPTRCMVLGALVTPRG